MMLKKGHVEGWREGWSSGTRRTQRQLNSASASVVQSEGGRATVSSALVLGCMWLVDGTCKHQSQDMHSCPSFPSCSSMTLGSYFSLNLSFLTCKLERRPLALPHHEGIGKEIG